jgi:hypothetical protein
MQRNLREPYGLPPVPLHDGLINEGGNTPKKRDLD